MCFVYSGFDEIQFWLSIPQCNAHQLLQARSFDRFRLCLFRLFRAVAETGVGDRGRGPGTVTGKDSQAFFNSSLLCATLPNGSSGALIQQGLYLSCVQLLLLPLKTGSQASRADCGATSASTLCPILSTLGALLFPETSSPNNSYIHR